MSIIIIEGVEGWREGRGLILPVVLCKRITQNITATKRRYKKVHTHEIEEQERCNVVICF